MCWHLGMKRASQPKQIGATGSPENREREWSRSLGKRGNLHDSLPDVLQRAKPRSEKSGYARPARKRENSPAERWLAESVDDPGFVEIVGRHFQLYAVAAGESDEALSHLSGDVREDKVLVGQLNAEHCSCENGDNFAFKLNSVFYSHGDVGRTAFTRCASG